LAAGAAPESTVVVNSSESSSLRAAEALGVRAGTLADIARADVLVLGIKPYQVDAVLPQVREHLRPDTLVISLAAGVSLERLAGLLPGCELLTRAMPNTPMAVGEG